MLVDLLRDEDGAVGAQRQGDGVGGAGVERYDFAGLVHPDGGVEGVLSEIADNDPGDARVEAVDDAAQKIVGHRPWGGSLLNLEGNGVGLEETNPDRENDLAGEVVEDHNGHLGGRVHHEAADADFDLGLWGCLFFGVGLESGEMHGGSVTLWERVSRQASRLVSGGGNAGV